jgi:hypothetical protein
MVEYLDHGIVAKFIDYTAPQIVVFGPISRFSRPARRPQMLFHELDFVLLSPTSRGHPPILVCINLVLNRDSSNGHPLLHVSQ